MGEGLLPALLAPAPGPNVQDGPPDRREPEVPSLPWGPGPPGCGMPGAMAGMRSGCLGCPQLRAETKSVGSRGPPAAGAGGRNPTKVLLRGDQRER